MTRMNGGQIIVDYLIQKGATDVFGLCGHGNISFIDALVMDLAMTAFFLVYTFVFNLVYDRIFPIPVRSGEQSG